MTTPPPDDFAMKVWREAYNAQIRPMMESIITKGAFDDLDGAQRAASQVLSDAFDKVRAEERARIVAWLRGPAGIWSHPLTDQAISATADAIEQGAAMDELIARDADLI